MTSSAVQIDLFASPAVAEGLTCLRDAVPEAMDVVVRLEYWDRRDDDGVSYCDEWVYTVRRAGLRFERRDEWCGVRSRMRVVTWAEIAEHVGGDPRRAGLIAWAASLPEPSWKERHRPHELWPNPGNWHPDYITNDRAHPGWPQRIAAWRTLLAILTDAIERLT